MKHYYLYRITNLVNDKVYIGVHQTNDMDDGYMGSGKLLKRAIAKHGIENFHKDILQTFDSKEDMFEAESILVNEEFVANDNNYNLKLGGEGGWDHIPNPSIEHMISMSHKGSAGRKEKLKWLFENDREWLDRKNAKFSASIEKRYHEGMINGFANKKHSQKAKQKIGKASSIHQSGEGNSMYGTMWIHNLELKESKRISKEDPIPAGWKKGRKIKFPPN